MTLEYEFALAGATSLDQVVARALPDSADQLSGTFPRLSADFYEKYGYHLLFLAGQRRVFDVDTDSGWQELEFGPYVSLTFSLDDEADWVWRTTNMITVVQRLLATGPEDALLTQNSDDLRLTRTDGRLVKHGRAAWWDVYPGANEAIPG